MNNKEKMALISVSDKTGIIDFARFLQEKFRYRILSTGGTLKHLQEAGLEVIPVDLYTESKEILGGRVKTLHPKIHAGILADNKNPEHVETMKQENYDYIDMVVVNLYPFEETVQSGADKQTIIENIDIGGPGMLRSAAKNFKRVAVVSSIDQYEPLQQEMKNNNGQLSLETRERLAIDVFSLTAHYNAVIAEELSSGERKSIHLRKHSQLKYGENPHQEAVLYSDKQDETVGSIVKALKHQGKEMGFLNYCDADAALNAVRDFSVPAVCIVKHSTPCGLATGRALLEAFKKAHDCDQTSAFGGIIAFNREVTAEIIQETQNRKMFIEVLIAPSFTEEALQLCKKKKNMRVLSVGEIGALSKNMSDVKKIAGGYLLQQIDVDLPESYQTVTTVQPTAQQMEDLKFAWIAVKYVKSNAIVVAKDGATVGVGSGQPNRVGATKIAVEQAANKAKGAVLASDAFFPFPDSIESAAAAGVTAIIQPGGSIRDAEVIAKANELNIAMVFTGQRAFRHL